MAFQATLELMAQQFPGAFAGYKLEVTESHQRQKADTSGTAKAVIASIAKLGAPISEVNSQEMNGSVLYLQAPRSSHRTLDHASAGSTYGEVGIWACPWQTDGSTQEVTPGIYSTASLCNCHRTDLGHVIQLPVCRMRL